MNKEIEDALCVALDAIRLQGAMGEHGDARIKSVIDAAASSPLFGISDDGMLEVSFYFEGVNGLEDEYAITLESAAQSLINFYEDGQDDSDTPLLARVRDRLRALATMMDQALSAGSAGK